MLCKVTHCTGRVSANTRHAIDLCILIYYNTQAGGSNEHPILLCTMVTYTMDETFHCNSHLFTTYTTLTPHHRYRTCLNVLLETRMSLWCHSSFVGETFGYNALLLSRKILRAIHKILFFSLMCSYFWSAIYTCSNSYYKQVAKIITFMYAMIACKIGKLHTTKWSELETFTCHFRLSYQILHYFDLN